MSEKESEEQISTITFEKCSQLRTIHTAKAPFYVGHDMKLLTFHEDDETGCLHVVDVDTFQPVSSIKLPESVTCFVAHPGEPIVFLTTVSHAFIEMNYQTKRTLSTKKTSHKQPVVLMAINALGSRLATGAADGEVRIRSMGPGDSAIKVCAYHQGKVTLLKFSPTEDVLVIGSLLMSDLTVWDADTGKMKAVLGGHQEIITDVDFHANLMASCARDNVIFVWDLRSLNRVATIPTFQSTEVMCFFHPSAEFAQQEFGVSSSSSYLLTGSQYGGDLRVWSVDQRCCVFPDKGATAKRSMAQTEAALLQCIRRVVRLPWSRAQHWSLLVQSSPSDFLLMVRENGTLQLWREMDLRLVQEFTFDLGEVNHMRLCGPERNILLTAENSSCLRLFPFLMDSTENKETESGPVFRWHCSVTDTAELMKNEDNDQRQGEDAVVTDVAIVPEDPTLIASVGKDCALVIWRLVLVKEEDALPNWMPAHLTLLHRQRRAHERHVTCVVFSQNGEHIFTCCADMELKRWSNPFKKLSNTTTVDSLKLSGNVPHCHTDLVNKMAASVDGRYLATASKDKTVKIWLNEMKSVTLVHTLAGHRRGVWAVEFSPTEKKVISVSGDSCVKVWSVDSGQQLMSLQENAKIYRANFLANGKDAILVNELGEVRVCNLDLRKPAPSQVVFSGSDHRVNCICLSQDEQRLFVGGQDGSVAVMQNVTEKLKLERQARQEMDYQHEQELRNLMLAKAYPEALQRALQLDRPKTCLTILETLLDKELDGENLVEQSLEDLDEELMDRLMQFSLRWMTNTRSEHVAHLVHHFVYRRFNMRHLIKNWTCFKSSGPVLQLGIRSAERAVSRLNSTLSLLGHIDFLCHAMPKSHAE